MRRQLLRLSIVLVVLSGASGASPLAAGDCPGHIYWTNPWRFCTLTHDGGCSACKYSCDDGTTPTYNMCGQ